MYILSINGMVDETYIGDNFRELRHKAVRVMARDCAVYKCTIHSTEGMKGTINLEDLKLMEEIREK